MSLSDRVNFASDEYDNSLAPSKLLDDRKNAREKSINNNKLFIAISKSNVEQVISLLEKVDINYKDQDGCTPLHWAVDTGDVNIIETLVKSGADLRSKNSNNETPIDVAEKMNRSQIVNILRTSLDTTDKPKIAEIRNALECKKQPSSQEQEEIAWMNPVYDDIYQLKVLMLFLHRGLACKYSFRLGTELKDAKKFDDLIFEYVEGNKKVYRLLQAKHKFDESEKITIDKLMTDSKGDYSLIKYFYSFQDFKNDSFFKDGTIKDIIICTNIDFDMDDLKKSGVEIRKVEEKDDILDIRSDKKESTRYKFTKSMISKLKSRLKPEYSDNDVEHFLNHLVFAINQPNEEELGIIVKEEIGREMGFLDTENAYNKLLIKLMDLSLGKGSRIFLSHQEGQSFFDDLKKEIPVWFNIQEPVISFTGRSKYLKQMHKAMKKSYVCITGMGGVGKTELVRQYIAEHGHEYDNKVVWINAESYRSAVDSFRQLASGKLNISLNTLEGKEKQITSVVSDVYQFFSKSSSLFIFDNAEKYECINESDCGINQFLPSLPDSCIKPNVIITSRNRKWPEGIKTIRLAAFDMDETKELVEKVLTIESDEEKELVLQLGEKLQYLPLALQQAVAYIKVQNEKLSCIGSGFGISNYLEKYSEMAEELLDFEFSEDSDSNYDRSVFATWNITFDTFKQKENGKDALDILNIISYCFPDNIPIKLLLVFSSDKEKLSSAIGLLKQYSIVRVHHKAVSVHRLIQQVTRIKLQKDSREVDILLDALYLLDRTDVNLKNLDHVISIWKYASKYSELFEEYIQLTSFIVAELRDCGRIEEAISIGNKVLSIEKTPSKRNMAHYMSIRKTVAICILDKGNYKKALEELQKVYEIETTSLGLKSSDNGVLNTKNSMALALVELGRFEEALQAYYELLDGFGVSMGENHPRILLTKSSISFILSEEGRYEEALAMLEKICQAQEKTLGEHHPETIAIKNHMAIVLGRLNRCEEAMKLLKGMYSYQEATLPKYHPKIICTMINMADILLLEQKYSSALEIFQEVCNVQKEKLGEDHPKVIHINVRIAIVLKSQGKYDKALEILNSALKKSQKILGPEHPGSIFAQTKIAEVLFKQQKYVDAIELYEEVLNKHKSVLSTCRHPSTLEARRSIVEILIEQNKYKAALKIALEVLEDSENFVGRNHSKTLIDKSNVATLYGYTGDIDKALAIYKEVLEAQREILGKDSKAYQDTEYNMSIMLRAKNEQQQQQRDYMSGCKRVLEQGLDINVKDPDGITMLHHALTCDNEPTVEYLLEQGAKVFVTSNKGNTPLHIAVLKGNEKFVKMLLQKLKLEKLNAFVDARTSTSGSTALHVAAKGGHFAIVKYLLKSHATFCAKNRDGKTPLDLSTDSKVTNFLKMVHEFFEKVKQADATDVVRKLEALPADEFLAVTNTRNDQRLTLVQVATLKKQKEVANTILQMIIKLKSQ